MPIVLEAPETKFVGFEPVSAMQTSSTTSTLPKDGELHVRFADIPGTDRVNYHNHKGNSSLQNRDSDIENGDSNHQNGEHVKQESTTDITAVVVLSENLISAVKDESDSSQNNLQSSSDSETPMENGMNQFEFAPYAVTPV